MSWKHLGFIDQAKELEYRIGKALQEMRLDETLEEKPEESEVAFRFSAIIGMLIIAKMDAGQIVKEWSQEDAERMADKAGRKGE